MRVCTIRCQCLAWKKCTKAPFVLLLHQAAASTASEDGQLLRFRIGKRHQGSATPVRTVIVVCDGASRSRSPLRCDHRNTTNKGSRSRGRTGEFPSDPPRAFAFPPPPESARPPPGCRGLPYWFGIIILDCLLRCDLCQRLGKTLPLRQRPQPSALSCKKAQEGNQRKKGSSVSASRLFTSLIISAYHRIAKFFGSGHRDQYLYRVGF